MGVVGYTCYQVAQPKKSLCLCAWHKHYHYIPGPDFLGSSTGSRPNQRIPLGNFVRLHVEASRKLEKVSLRLRFETAFVFLFPSKLGKRLASNQNQEILLIDGFASTVFWPRDMGSLYMNTDRENFMIRYSGYPEKTRSKKSPCSCKQSNN